MSPAADMLGMAFKPLVHIHGVLTRLGRNAMAASIQLREIQFPAQPI
jgi:hypothetical protein